MNLELNLVKNTGIYDKVFTLLSRTRVKVSNDSEVMSSILTFIGENINVFDSVFSDKGFVDRLENLDTLTNEHLFGLKFIMAQSGIDLIFYTVSDDEDNPVDIPEGMIEYISINNIHSTSLITKFATKFVMSESNLKVSEVYKTMNEIYDNFGGELLSDLMNPIQSQIQFLERDENYIGVTPTSITNYLNSVFNYLGKDLIVITN
jgi:hypothetical protein